MRVKINARNIKTVIFKRTWWASNLGWVGEYRRCFYLKWIKYAPILRVMLCFNLHSSGPDSILDEQTNGKRFCQY